MVKRTRNRKYSNATSLNHSVKNNMVLIKGKFWSYNYFSLISCKKELDEWKAQYTRNIDTFCNNAITIFCHQIFRITNMFNRCSYVQYMFFPWWRVKFITPLVWVFVRFVFVKLVTLFCYFNKVLWLNE